MKGDYGLSIIDSKINIRMRFYSIELELIQPEFQLNAKPNFISHTPFLFLIKAYKYLKLKFLITFDILDQSFG